MSRPHYPSSRHDRPHARLYDHDLNHPAWNTLSGNAFKLISRYLAMYREQNPNSFAAGGASVAKLIGVDEKTGRKAVDELISAGHLREERRGRNRGMVKTRERVVSLTRYHTEIELGDPARPIKVWEQKLKTENTEREHRKKSGFGKELDRGIRNDDGAEVIALNTRSTRI